MIYTVITRRGRFWTQDPAETGLSAADAQRLHESPTEDDGLGERTQAVYVPAQDLEVWARRSYCVGCGCLNPTLFMVHDALWAAVVSDPRALLCLQCFQSRLGRPVTRADLRDVPCNAMFGILDEIPADAPAA